MSATHDAPQPLSEQRTPAATETVRVVGRNALAAAAGNVAFNLCRFATLMLLAKYAGDTATAAFNTAHAWTAPIATTAMLQLRGVFIADQRLNIPFVAYLTLRRRAMMVAGMLIVAIALWRGVWAGASLLFVVILLAIGVSKIAWALAEIYWAIFQRAERLGWMGAGQAVRGLAMLAPFGVLPFVADETNGAPWAAAICCWVFPIAWLVLTRAYERSRAGSLASLETPAPPGAGRRLLRRASPLALVILIVSLCDNAPLLLLSEIHPEAVTAQAVFGVFAYLGIPLNLLIVQAGHAAGQRLAAGTPIERRRLTAMLITTALGLGLAGIGLVNVAGAWFVGTFFRPEYVAFIDDLETVMIGVCGVLVASALGIIVTYRGRFWIQVPAQLITLGVTVVVGLQTIPDDPVGGAAMSLLARGVTQTGTYAITLLMIGVFSQKSDATPRTPAAD